MSHLPDQALLEVAVARTRTAAIVGVVFALLLLAGGVTLSWGATATTDYRGTVVLVLGVVLSGIGLLALISAFRGPS